jgi:isopenicillin-N N-acyltransferase-like protein
MTDLSSPFPLIDVDGPPRERGIAHGRQAGDRIDLGARIYADALASAGARARALGYFEALESYDPDCAEEVRGIAEGAQQPLEIVVALNARTELTAWDSASPQADECTAALAMPERTGGPLLHGQTWDWRPACAASSIVLRIRDDNGPDILTFCEAGQLARHGLNSAGLALTANGLQTEGDFVPGGICAPFVRRRMLASQSLAAATGILMLAPRSASHNIMLSHSGGPGESEAINFETTTSDLFWSFPEQGLLTHANHFKAPAALARLTDLGLLRHPESLYRDRRVRAHLELDGSAIGIGSFKRAFADRYGAPDAVCRSPSRRSDGSVSATVASLVMDAAAGRMWVAPSPYLGAASYTEYRLDG